MARNTYTLLTEVEHPAYVCRTYVTPINDNYSLLIEHNVCAMTAGDARAYLMHRASGHHSPFSVVVGKFPFLNVEMLERLDQIVDYFSLHLRGK